MQVHHILRQNITFLNSDFEYWDVRRPIHALASFFVVVVWLLSWHGISGVLIARLDAPSKGKTIDTVEYFLKATLKSKISSA